MASIWFKSVPLSKEDITLALEAGVDGLIVPKEDVPHVAQLARCGVCAAEDMPAILLTSKEDEEAFVEKAQKGTQQMLAIGWEIIPVENILAQCDHVAAEVRNLDEARLAAGILERGVHQVVALPSALMQLKSIIHELKTAQGNVTLQKALVTKVQNVGLGHRVCVDTLTMMHKGQGMLVGNSSAFTFLVHAETEHNAYVASRPFRVNAGAVHAYAHMPNDTTSYLGELRSGDEMLIISADGTSSIATIGRVKVEVRPMLLVEAQMGDAIGTVFLQNAETICLTRADGSPVSVVALQEGDTILCHSDTAGRHFGMRIEEEIQEI